MDGKGYSCGLDPSCKKSLRVFLFTDVQNLKEVREGVMSGRWAIAAVRPALVLAPLQLAAAANRAALAAHRGRLVTKTPFTEILFNLSLSKNISQSLTKFGIQQDKDLLVCFLIDDDNSENVVDEILPQIKGRLCDIAELSQFVNMPELLTVYKLNKLDIKSENDLLDLIISRIVTKDFISH